MFTKLLDSVRNCVNNPNLGRNLGRVAIDLLKHYRTAVAVTGTFASACALFSINPLIAGPCLAVPLGLIYRNEVLQLIKDFPKTFAHQGAATTVAAQHSQQPQHAASPSSVACATQSNSSQAQALAALQANAQQQAATWAQQQAQLQAVLARAHEQAAQQQAQLAQLQLQSARAAEAARAQASLQQATQPGSNSDARVAFVAGAAIS